MEREKVTVAAGVVALVGRRGGWKVLVVRGMLGAHPELGYFGFPKGLVSEGEDEMKAAGRETREETGREVRIIEKVGETRYKNRWGEKRVDWFLAEVGEDVGERDDEFVWAGLVPVAVALRGLTHKSDREILKRALKRMKEMGYHGSNG